MFRFAKYLGLPLLLLGCGPAEPDYGPEQISFEGAAIDAAPPAPSEAEASAPIENANSALKPIGFKELSLAELGQEGTEDLLDAQLYPDEYSPEERAFPAQIQALDQQNIRLRGYMIPTHNEDGKVYSFLVVGDLLSCCFGGAPKADQWVKVEMAKGKHCDYFAYVPIIVHGRFWIQVIEDEAGYAAGCYQMEATEVEREK